MRVIDINPIRIIRMQSERAATLVAIDGDDERRIYRHALRDYRHGASLGWIIGQVHKEATQCAKCKGMMA